MRRAVIPNRRAVIPNRFSGEESAGSRQVVILRRLQPSKDLCISVCGARPFDFAQGGLTRQRSAVHRFFAALRMTKVMNTRRHKAYSDSHPHQLPQSISLGEKCSVLSDLSTQTLACSVRWLGVTSTMTPLPLEYEQLI